MIRVSRMADYGVVAMTHIARRAEDLHTAASVADATGVPLPSATKLLKLLARQGILASQRGAHGGYTLKRRPADVSVADLIVAIDGPIALADCLHGDEGAACGLESFCSIRSPWQKVSDAIRVALEEVSLAEMIAATAYVPPPGEPPPRPRAEVTRHG
ncbi:MAG: SUF system Fe-S cluster assembly regulator [Alphaproteobacteria bacterium]|nr:SUF system Fe-S cluster assembly regulator [Alphaproteobacteria bacterium]